MPLTLILGFLRKFWPYILVAIVVFGAYHHYMGLIHKIDTLTTENTTLQAKIAETVQQLSECANANKTFQGEIQKFNASIDKWAKASDDQLKKMKQLQTNVDTKQDAITTQVLDILKQPKPQSCEQAIQYLIDARKAYSKTGAP